MTETPSDIVEQLRKDDAVCQSEFAQFCWHVAKSRKRQGLPPPQVETLIVDDVGKPVDPCPGVHLGKWNGISWSCLRSLRSTPPRPLVPTGGRSMYSDSP